MKAGAGMRRILCARPRGLEVGLRQVEREHVALALPRSQAAGLEPLERDRAALAARAVLAALLLGLDHLGHHATTSSSSGGAGQDPDRSGRTSVTLTREKPSRTANG